MEFWNLVFMQYVQDEPVPRGREPALRASIDTGMGLERVAMLAPGGPQRLRHRPGPPGAGRRRVRHRCSLRRRAGVRREPAHPRRPRSGHSPSSSPTAWSRPTRAAGYVLRRLVRRAVRHAWQLGAERPVTPALVDATVRGAWGTAYPALPSRPRRHRRDGRARGGPVPADPGVAATPCSSPRARGGARGRNRSGARPAFRLHDTYGFPVELTEEIAAERGIGVDRVAFDGRDGGAARRGPGRLEGGPDAVPTPRRSTGRSSTPPAPPTSWGTSETEHQGDVLAPGRATASRCEQADDGERGGGLPRPHPVLRRVRRSGGRHRHGHHRDGASWRSSTPSTPVPGLHGHRAIVRRGTVRVGQEAPPHGRRRAARADSQEPHRHPRPPLGAAPGGRPARAAGRFPGGAGALPLRLLPLQPLVDDELVAEVERVGQRAGHRECPGPGVPGGPPGGRGAGGAGLLRRQVRRAGPGGGSRRPTAASCAAAPTSRPPARSGRWWSWASPRSAPTCAGSRPTPDRPAYAYLSELRRQLETAASHLRSPARSSRRGRGGAGRQDRKPRRSASRRSRRAARSAEAARLVDRPRSRGGHRLVVAARAGMQPDELRQLAIQVRDRLGSGVVVLGSERDGKAGLVVAVTPRPGSGRGVGGEDRRGRRRRPRWRGEPRPGAVPGGRAPRRPPRRRPRGGADGSPARRWVADVGRVLALDHGSRPDRRGGQRPARDHRPARTAVLAAGPGVLDRIGTLVADLGRRTDRGRSSRRPRRHRGRGGRARLAASPRRSADATGLPIELVDERFSTVIAERVMIEAGQRRDRRRRSPRRRGGRGVAAVVPGRWAMSIEVERYRPEPADEPSGPRSRVARVRRARPGRRALRPRLRRGPMAGLGGQRRDRPTLRLARWRPGCPSTSRCSPAPRRRRSLAIWPMPG